MQVVDAILFWANATPARPAIIQPHGVQTYRMLADSIIAAAGHFARSELDPAKPVAVAIEDPARMLVASLGLLHAGFRVVPTTQALLSHLALTGADTLVSEHGGLIWTDHTTVLFNESWMGAHAGRPDAGTVAATAAGPENDMIFFTSGSTGRPKMIVHTPQARTVRIRYLKDLTVVDFERALVVPSLFSTYGFYTVISILDVGKTVCFAPFGQPALLLANVYNVDMMVASAQQAIALAEIQEKGSRIRLASLKALRTGGGMLSRQGADRLKRNLCRNIIMAYSATEAGAMALAPHDMIAGIPDAVGFLVPGVKVEIVDAAGTVLPTGSEGFVRVQTPLTNVLAAARKPDSGPEPHWYYPGDIGRLTDKGVLCIAGRGEDLLNRGGVKLSTIDVEEYLLAAPGVRDAGVCSMMGEAGFAEIWVGVVLEDGADMGEFRRHIESNQKFSGNIDKMFVVEEIPRGENRKLQREQLQAMLKSIIEEA
jgi:acyl-coenzyme A synthetase/AMP-(fatty) acid ligase